MDSPQSMSDALAWITTELERTLFLPCEEKMPHGSFQLDPKGL